MDTNSRDMTNGDRSTGTDSIPKIALSIRIPELIELLQHHAEGLHQQALGNAGMLDMYKADLLVYEGSINMFRNHTYTGSARLRMGQELYSSCSEQELVYLEHRLDDALLRMGISTSHIVRLQEEAADEITWYEKAGAVARNIFFYGILAPLTLLQGSQVPDAEPADMESLRRKLRATAYGDRHPDGHSFEVDTNMNRSPQYVELISRPLLAVAHGLPRGMPGPNDYDDGHEMGVKTAIGVVGLVGGALESATDEQGNFVGSVRLHYERGSRGQIIRWSVQETYFDPMRNENLSRLYPVDQAIELFNGRSLSSGAYYRVENLLRYN